MTKSETDWLERRLRLDAQERLADEGFTRRVLQALPARASHRWRTALIFASTAIGSAAAIAIAPVGPMVLQGFVDLVRLHAFTTPAAAAVAMVAVLSISGLVLAVETD